MVMRNERHHEKTSGKPERNTSPALPAPAVSYVAGVVGVCALASVLVLLQAPPHGLHILFYWTLAALAGELMIFATATGRAQINLATTVHLAMILALGPGEIVAVMWLSRSVAKFIIKRQVWYRALFNVAQATGAALVASLCYQGLGGSGAMELSLSGLLRIAPAFGVAALAYYGLNTVTVSGVVALTTADTFWRAWRENYGYAAEMASTAALILMAPVTTLCYQSLGPAGLIVFLLPTFFIHATSVRYIALRRAQQDFVCAERMAAKNEIAAEVGQEINDCLTTVSGHIQLLAMKGSHLPPDEVQKRLGTVARKLEQITTMGKGLTEFSSNRTRLAPTRVTELVRNTIAFLEPQDCFQNVHLRIDLDERLGEILVDPTQIQQAVTNLLLNAATAMARADTEKRMITVRVRLHDVSGKIEISVADSGPGIPSHLHGRVFEPGFSTHDGKGYGLSSTYRIVTTHGGSISIGEADSGGALLRILLPVSRKLAA
jgi:signal transduction histidine kinase